MNGNRMVRAGARAAAVAVLVGGLAAGTAGPAVAQADVEARNRTYVKAESVPDQETASTRSGSLGGLGGLLNLGLKDLSLAGIANVPIKHVLNDNNINIPILSS
ncbi:hypothetical protein AB0I72_25905 [Nocardiopsis sp. NPDC049922]|uniref:hypothetical protein n=1 Tax=Nocardiopsis sp. NPDC049922 TaxID=3155157 RepID=UPI0033DBEF7F